MKDGALDVVPPLVLHENETVRTGALTLLSNLSTVGPVPSSSYSPPPNTERGFVLGDV